MKSVILSALATMALTGPAMGGPKVHPERTMVIKGIIQQNNLEPLGKILLQAKDSVDLVIDSPGGSVETGSIFISYMESAKARGVVINCFVPTLAASMAFGILTHCDHRYALTKSFLLWHRARVMLGGMMGAPMTAPQLLVIGKDLDDLDKEIFRETAKALAIDPETVRYHFEAETLHLGVNLHKMAPDFITVYDNIPGLLEALHNDKLPHNKQPNPFGFLFGELIYISNKVKYSNEAH